MTDIGDRRRVPSPAGRYCEPARSYLSTAAFGSLIAAGFGLDLALGGGRAHLAGWLIAFGVVVGIDALTVHAARVLRTVTVTDTHVRVGDDAVPRAEILGVEVGVRDPTGPIMGRTGAEGLPRGCVGVSLRLADGRHLIVPTRRPKQLAASLGVELDVSEVRPGSPADMPLLAEIAERAGTLFTVAGLQLPPMVFPVDALIGSPAIFVHGHPPVGFVRVEQADGLAHVEELAVLPSHMRRGIGSALLEAACVWAAGRGYPAITVITFADVPWNGPFYAARGFVEVKEATPELAERRDWERAAGLDEVGHRVVMRREL